MMVTIFKYLIITIFLGSAIGKIVGFDDTLVYFVAITKISFPILAALLWILISIELLISGLILINYLRFRTIFLSIQFLLVTFFITNTLFFVSGVENCACFGVGLQSHPLVGALKTMILIMLINYLQRGKFFPVWFITRKIER